MANGGPRLRKFWKATVQGTRLCERIWSWTQGHRRLALPYHLIHASQSIVRAARSTIPYRMSIGFDSRFDWLFDVINLKQSFLRGRPASDTTSNKHQDDTALASLGVAMPAFSLRTNLKLRLKMCLKLQAQNCEAAPVKLLGNGTGLKMFWGRFGAFFKVFVPLSVSLFVLEFETFRGNCVLQRCHSKYLHLKSSATLDCRRDFRFCTNWQWI